jgi:predicted nucleic acid-binding protein
VTFLLDVNVLIALIDPGHVAHDDAHEWFAAMGQTAWATCPITENGVIRIVGNPKYPNSPGSPSLVMEIVRKLRSLPGHSFWPDDVSPVGSGDIAATKILTSGQVTVSFSFVTASSVRWVRRRSTCSLASAICEPVVACSEAMAALAPTDRRRCPEAPCNLID